MTDSELIKKCRQGSDSAWAMLVSRYERLVYTIPLRYGMSQVEAEDVYQIVWLKLLKNLPSLKQPEKVASWLVTTTKHECWNRGRHQDFKRLQTTDPQEMPDIWQEDALPEKIVARYETHQSLRDALHRLGQRCRRLLQALYYDPTNPSYTEIGQRLEMPAGAIGPNRARCLKKLRNLWEG